MSLFKRISKAVFNEVTKPKSFAVGEEFENYLREEIFPIDYYDLIHRTHDYNVNKDDYVETSLEPDFVFCSIKNNKEFMVEAKYRSHFNNDSVIWCKKYQLERYLDINKDIPVFIAIGIEGYPDYPEYLYIIPVKHIKYTKLYKSFLKRFEFRVDKPVDPYRLWRLLSYK